MPQGMNKIAFMAIVAERYGNVNDLAFILWEKSPLYVDLKERQSSLVSI